MSIKQFNQRLDEIEAKYYFDRFELLKERNTWIGEQWPLYKSGKFSVAIYEDEQWECEKSPIGICIYEDGREGEYCCHFCGQPEERR